MSLANNDEIMGILESLVADNETLVHSNTELQSMLADAREELHALQEEAEEHRAATSLSHYGMPYITLDFSSLTYTCR